MAQKVWTTLLPLVRCSPKPPLMYLRGHTQQALKSGQVGAIKVTPDIPAHGGRGGAGGTHSRRWQLGRQGPSKSPLMYLKRKCAKQGVGRGSENLGLNPEPVPRGHH